MVSVEIHAKDIYIGDVILDKDYSPMGRVARVIRNTAEVVLDSGRVLRFKDPENEVVAIVEPENV